MHSMLRWVPVAAIALSAVTVLTAAVGREDAATRVADRRAGEAKASERLTKVTQPKLVCMVNDQFMGRDQIPVAVEGRMYYGCCAMCKERLAKDAAARSALDPVTGKKVDKSKAVIGRAADGTVAYFESEANLDKFNSTRR